MLIKAKSDSMEIVKTSLTPREKCTCINLMNHCHRKELATWKMTHDRYIVKAKADVLYYLIYNLAKNFDIEIM